MKVKEIFNKFYIGTFYNGKRTIFSESVGLGDVGLINVFVDYVVFFQPAYVTVQNALNNCLLSLTFRRNLGSETLELWHKLDIMCSQVSLVH